MVIQRWQSVLLLLACVMMACFSFLSLGQVQAPDFTYNFTAMGFFPEGEPSPGASAGVEVHTWIFFIVSIVSALLALIDIFLFRDLRKQRRVALFTMLMILATAIIGVYYGYATELGGQISWSSVIIMVPIALVAVICAYRLIGADRKKIESSTSLR